MPLRNALRGLPATCNPWIGFILLFVFGLTPLYYQFEMNKIVDRYAVAAGAPISLTVQPAGAGAPTHPVRLTHIYL